MTDEMLDPVRQPASASAEAGAVEPRFLAAWREWLAALATDAEAAIAAAQVYGALPAAARDTWLDALAEDATQLAVPRVALYAPLLSVESDPARRRRMVAALGGSDMPQLRVPAAAPRRVALRTLRGFADDGTRVAVLVRRLYLSFVQVLSSRYHPDGGFDWVRVDSMLVDRDAPADGTRLDGILLESTPTKPVVEELAHAVLAQRRRGLELPSSLHSFVDVFSAELDGDAAEL